MIVKKAQGLMSDAEMEALLSNYFIYLVTETTHSVNYDDSQKEELTLGGVGYNNLSAYTISPADYNLLMEIGRQFKTKNILYVIVSYENEFSIEDFSVDIKIPVPTEVLKRHNINTKLGKYQPRTIHRKALITMNDFEHLNPEEAENFLDRVLTEVIKQLEDNSLPTKPLTVEGYMNHPDLVRFPNDTAIFTLNYNADQLKDKYIKERNIVFPENFTDGFEKYFNEDGIKRVIRKIRKFINKAGGREKRPNKSNVRLSLYLKDKNRDIPYTVEIFTKDIERTVSPYMEIAEIKELDPSVFENMRNYILSGMKTYYEIKGFSRPLTESRLSARAISREVTSLIRTAVTSSLPGFQTAQGQQRGYTFNKSVRVNIDTPLGLFEAVYRKNPEAMKIFKFNLNGLLMDQPISETIKNRILHLVGDSYEIKLDSSAGFDIRESGYGFLITDQRIGSACYYFNTTTFKDFISNLGNQQISINDAIMESGALLCTDNGLTQLSSMIKESFSEFDEFRRSLEPAGRTGSIYGNKVSAPVGLMLPRGRRGENIAVVDFIFSFSGEGRTFSNFRLESAEVNIYRRRNLNRTFEIDINAEYGFDLEIRRVINRVLNPQDFYDANTNPRERSTRWIIQMVRGVSNLPNVIMIEEPKYDSLTGSTRGIWLIFSEGIGVNYFTIDDAKQGQGSSKSGMVLRGSLCVGNANFYLLSPDADYREDTRLFEHNDKKYIFSATDSSCVNLLFPEEATEEDVERGAAREVGQLISTQHRSKLKGGNLDAMGFAVMATATAGNLLGQAANERAVSESAKVNIPVFSQVRQVITKENLRYNFTYDTLTHTGTEEVIEVSDLKILFRFLHSGFRREIIERIKDSMVSNNPDLIDVVFNELGITYRFRNESMGLNQTNTIKTYFSNAFLMFLTDDTREVTTIDEIKSAIEANKDKIKESILRVRLGADYGGEGFPDEDYVFLDDLESRKRRKRRAEQRRG